jgi:serine/threonine protein kinase/WD40 repeat protein
LMNEHDVFNAAVKLLPIQRSSFLDAACAGQPQLRDEVESLLRAHDESGGILRDDPDRAIPPTVISPSPFIPAMLIAGRYKLLEQIGEGGMGTVWVAEQIQPIRRKVALKLIKEGMDSKSVLARFEAERQALALMDHPNIAKILDAGMTEQGRPFFVMEYVKGVPLTEYSDQARLTIGERLELFLPVCHAVQHAHQKGIIHRDLKPSNILICLYDGKPVAKVIDFGLAKAMRQSLTEQTLYTAHGVMLGTPLYMSPEQAEFNNLDIDTRADVYSLGVILYELLTGSTPLEKKRIQEAALQEMLRLIKEEEPLRPSTRLTSSGTLPTIAAQRKVEPIKLGRMMSGELDWIVMKALEKDRSRRYGSPSDFAADVSRYLNNDVVQARPPSALYRFSKLANQHRTAAITVSAFLLLLTIATIISTREAMHAREAELYSREREVEAEQALAAEEEARKKAELQSFLVQFHDARHQYEETLSASAFFDSNDYQAIQRTFIRPVLKLAHLLMTVLASAREFAPGVTFPVRPGVQVWKNRFALSSDQRLMVTLTDDGKFQLVDFPGMTLRHVLNSTELSEVWDKYQCGFLGRDRVCWTFCSDHLRLWDVATGKRLGEWSHRDHQFQEVYGSNDGTCLVTRSDRQEYSKASDVHESQSLLRLWDVNSATQVAVLDVPDVRVNFVAFSPNGTEVIASMEGLNELRVWSSLDGKLVRRIDGFAEPVEGFAFSESGKTLAVCTRKCMHWFNTVDWSQDQVATQLSNNADLVNFFPVFISNSEQFARAAVRTNTSYPPKSGLGAHRGSTTSLAFVPLRQVGSLILDSKGDVYNLETMERIVPVHGQKLVPEAKQFAVRGRWLQTLDGLIDLEVNPPRLITSSVRPFPFDENGWIYHLGATGVGFTVWLLPEDPESIETDQVLTWLELLTRAELTEEDEVRYLDERAWELRRRKLAEKRSRPGKYQLAGVDPDDRLFWLRNQMYETRQLGPETMSQLDRLVHAEPIWSHYLLRARWRSSDGQFGRALEDELEACRIGGTIAWQQLAPAGSDAGWSKQLMIRSSLSDSDLKLLLNWTEERRKAGIQDRFYDLLKGLIFYRQRNLQECIHHLSGFQVLKEGDWSYQRHADVVLIRAMARKQVGDSEAATTDFVAAKSTMEGIDDNFFEELLAEAETLFTPMK